MLSPLTNRKQNRKRFLPLIILPLLFALILFTPLRGYLASTVTLLGRPLLYLKEGVSVRSAYVADYFRSRKMLAQENAVLQEKLVETENLRTENEFLRSEYGRLLSLLGREESGRKRILATILARPNISPYDVLSVDVGSDKGLLVGERVYLSETIVVGEVKEVFAHSSKIELYSASGKETPVLVGSTTIPATATGLGGQNFSVRLPRNLGVLPGDIVSLTTLEPGILGIVKEIRDDPNDALLTIIFRSPANVEEARFVLVELPKE